MNKVSLQWNHQWRTILLYLIIFTFILLQQSRNTQNTRLPHFHHDVSNVVGHINITLFILLTVKPLYVHTCFRIDSGVPTAIQFWIIWCCSGVILLLLLLLLPLLLVELIWYYWTDCTFDIRVDIDSNDLIWSCNNKSFILIENIYIIVVVMYELLG